MKYTHTYTVEAVYIAKQTHIEEKNSLNGILDTIFVREVDQHY